MTVGSNMQVQVAEVKGGQCLEALTHAIKRLDPLALVSVDVPGGLIDVVTTQPEQAVIMSIREQGLKVLSTSGPAH